MTVHIAPEPALDGWLKSISATYLSVDLMSKAMSRMDLGMLGLSDNCVTLFWCSHVLEHVPDDRKAMAEIFRVLQPGGRAVIQVPIVSEKTFEDSTITTPEDRLRVFGQSDHVRIYGPDIEKRLEDTGFVVTVRSRDEIPDALVQSCRLLDSTKEVYVCTKP